MQGSQAQRASWRSHSNKQDARIRVYIYIYIYIYIYMYRTNLTPHNQMVAPHSCVLASIATNTKDGCVTYGCPPAVFGDAQRSNPPWDFEKSHCSIGFAQLTRNIPEKQVTLSSVKSISQGDGAAGIRTSPFTSSQIYFGRSLPVVTVPNLRER